MIVIRIDQLSRKLYGAKLNKLARNLAEPNVPDFEISCTISSLITNPKIKTNIYSKKSFGKYNFDMIENYENHGYCSRPLNFEPMV